MADETSELASEEVIQYFRKVVWRYSRGDVEELLAKCRLAGPPLQVVVNGIDLVGGMCYGFKDHPSNVRDRSIAFMRDHMNIPVPLAEVLYKCVRCGVTHQGVPKFGVIYFMPSERSNRRPILAKGPHDVLLLDVREFAQTYLQAVESIATNPKEYIRFRPRLNDDAKDAFEKALAQAPDADEDVLAMLGLASYSANSPNGNADWFEVESTPEIDEPQSWR